MKRLSSTDLFVFGALALIAVGAVELIVLIVKFL
jgi:hypothetical protein